MEDMIPDNSKLVEPTLKRLKRNFYTHKTKSLAFRLKQLKRFREGIVKYRPDLVRAVGIDLGIKETLGNIVHLNGVLCEVDDTIAHFKKWA
jgi:aldehyde dehydrogenase (NAD+)